MRGAGDAPGTGVSIDLGAIDVRALGGHPLVRAIGKGAGPVIDATAGLGGDAWILAASGRTVTAIERNPSIHALLEDALVHARATPTLAHVAARITLVHGDARSRLAGLANGAWAILVDPMFPPKQKSALAPRDIRLEGSRGRRPRCVGAPGGCLGDRSAAHRGQAAPRGAAPGRCAAPRDREPARALRRARPSAPDAAERIMTVASWPRAVRSTARSAR